jgi:hypothetical protein
MVEQEIATADCYCRLTPKIFLATAFSGWVILSTASIKREMMKQFVWTTAPAVLPSSRPGLFLLAVI